MNTVFHLSTKVVVLTLYHNHLQQISKFECTFSTTWLARMSKLFRYTKAFFKKVATTAIFLTIVLLLLTHPEWSDLIKTAVKITELFTIK